MIVDVREAAHLLRAGAVVAYPTETVFGLGADVSDPRALEALLALKGRAADRGMAVLVRGPDALESCLPELPEAAGRLARAFWPGPLTLVLRPVPALLAAVATELGVGFRCSAHPVAASLAKLVERPIAATSCNRSGEPPCTSAAEVLGRFGSELPVLAGRASGLAPSTVVAVSPAGELRILREGAILASELSHPPA